MKRILLVALAMVTVFCMCRPVLAAGLLNFSFDDSIDNHEAFLYMDTHGMVGTENVVTGWVGANGRLTWDGIADRANHKWEIGNHTSEHGNALSLTPAAFAAQVKAAQAEFLKRGFLQVTSLAVPFGDIYKKDKSGSVVLPPLLLSTIKGLKIINTARQAYTGDNPSPFNYAKDFNPWAIRVYSWKQGDSLSKLTALGDQAYAENAFLVIVIHTVAQYPDPNDQDQISLDDFTRFIDYVAIEISQGRIITTTTSDGAGQMLRLQLALPPATK